MVPWDPHQKRRFEHNADATTQHSTRQNAQGQARRRAQTWYKRSGAHSAFAGAAFQFDAENTERTVSDGARWAKGPGPIIEERFNRQTSLVCAALPRREGTAVRIF